VALNSRLSPSALLTRPWSFEQDLAFWSELGCQQVGLYAPKVAAFGFDAAIDALKSRGLRVSCVVTGMWQLREPETWPAFRYLVNESLLVAKELGGCVYGVSGAGRFDEWDQDVRAFVDAIAPCLTEAGRLDVPLALEPTMIPEISFVRTLADGIEATSGTGLKVVVDVGNCWWERDVLNMIRKMGDRIGLVQLSDYRFGSMDAPGFTKAMPGEGGLPIDRFVEAAVAAGYTGAFDIEVRGPDVPDTDAIRRSLTVASNMLDAVLSQ
jgi:sugar phosphate isomerase/epimerase